MDGARDHVEQAGAWTANVRGGTLTVTRDGVTRDLGGGVLPELAWSGDSLVYPQGDLNERDLMVVHLPDGAPERLTDWPGYEDRPVWSPDGTRVAFFAGRTGLPSLYLLDIATRAVTQLTNVGVSPRAPRPGIPPDGFVPPPDSGTATWTGTTLTWTARGQPITVVAP